MLLVLGAALGAGAGPPDSTLPGRKPGSTEPWELFLGRAAHIAIGEQYRVEHPTDIVFVDTTDLHGIVQGARLGRPERLTKFARRLRPDITNTTARVLFEIKPDNAEGLEQGRDQAGRYLSALNGAANPDKQFVGGTDFEGSLFLDFEEGGALWRLSWRTPEPGVTLYKWSYRRKKSGASWAQRAAQKEEVLSQDEMEKHAGRVEQVLRAAYAGSEFPSGFQGQVYLPVDCHRP